MCNTVKTMCHAAVAPQANMEKEQCRTAVSLSEYHALLCEVKSLNQTVTNLSDQHALLLEIRNAVLKVLRCSKKEDVFRKARSSPSQDEQEQDEAQPSSSPSPSRDLKKHIEMAKRHFRRSGGSESCISFSQRD